MNKGEITQKWVITKKLGLYKNERVKVPVTRIEKGSRAISTSTVS